MRLAPLCLILLAAPLLIGAFDPSDPQPTKVIRQPPKHAAPAPVAPQTLAPPPTLGQGVLTPVPRTSSATPLAMLVDPLAECRRSCSPSYYQCLSGDDASSCSPAWLQCRADCAKPAPAGL